MKSWIWNPSDCLFNIVGQEGEKSESLSPSEEMSLKISTENLISIPLEKKKHNDHWETEYDEGQCEE